MIGLVTIVLRMCGCAGPGPDAGACAGTCAARRKRPRATWTHSDRSSRRSSANTKARIADLEKRLTALGPPAQAPETARRHPRPSPPPPPPPAEAGPRRLRPGRPPRRPVTPPVLQPDGRPVPSGKLFNPDMAVIGNFLGAAGNEPHRRHAGSGSSMRRRRRSRRSSIPTRAVTSSFRSVRTARRWRKGSSRSPAFPAACSSRAARCAGSSAR